MKKILIMIVLLLFSINISAAEDLSNWAKPHVESLKETKQFGKLVFDEYKEDITRGEFIYLIVRTYEILCGEEIEIGQEKVFKDINPDYTPYAKKAALKGISNGMEEGKFGYKEKLTREQMTTLMVRTLELLEIDMLEATDEKFSDDSSMGSWAKAAIYKAKINNIVNGVGNNEFKPKELANKQTALALVNKVLKANNGKTVVGGVKADIYRETTGGRDNFFYNPTENQISFKEPIMDLNNFYEKFQGGIAICVSVIDNGELIKYIAFSLNEDPQKNFNILELVDKELNDSMGDTYSSTKTNSVFIDYMNISRPTFISTGIFVVVDINEKNTEFKSTKVNGKTYYYPVGNNRKYTKTYIDTIY